MCLCSCILAVGLASSLSAEELDSLYLQNAYAIQTLRVQWRFELHDNGLNTRYPRRWGRELERQLEAGIVPPALLSEYGGETGIREALKRFEALTDLTEEQQFQTHDRDFWTDRLGFQIRMQRLATGRVTTWGPAPPRFSMFPDEITTPETLVDVFELFRVVSYSPEQRFRVWVGDTGGAMGIVSETHPEKPYFPFPPLAMPEPEWLVSDRPTWDGQWYDACSMDVFYQRPASFVRVYDPVELEGTSVTPVVKVFIDRGRPEFGLAIRAFVDVSRGGIPLLMESFVCSPTFPDRMSNDFSWLPEDPVSDWSREPRPAYQLRVTRIDEVQTGVYYPVEGEYRTYTTTADFPDPQADEPILLETLPWEEHVHITWTAHDVDVDLEMPTEMFDFQLPPQTIYHDVARGANFVAGDLDGHAERIVGGFIPEPKPRTSNLQWYLLASCLGLLALFVFWKSRRASA